MSRKNTTIYLLDVFERSGLLRIKQKGNNSRSDVSKLPISNCYLARSAENFLPHTMGNYGSSMHGCISPMVAVLPQARSQLAFCSTQFELLIEWLYIAHAEPDIAAIRTPDSHRVEPMWPDTSFHRNFCSINRHFALLSLTRATFDINPKSVLPNAPAL